MAETAVGLKGINDGGGLMPSLGPLESGYMPGSGSHGLKGESTGGLKGDDGGV